MSIQDKINQILARNIDMLSELDGKIAGQMADKAEARGGDWLEEFESRINEASLVNSGN